MPLKQPTGFSEDSIPHGQYQSPIFGSLPRELRDSIYLEVWRSFGLSLHLFWHSDDFRNSKFCSWPCEAEFHVGDKREQELEAICGNDDPPQFLHDRLWNGRIGSHWLNHWQCEEKILQAREDSGFPPTKMEDTFDKSHCPCRKLYLECIQSLYKSTTFVLTGPTSLRTLLGRTTAAPDVPASFLKHICKLEISLPYDFYSHGLVEDSPYDFRWLRLGDLVPNCRQLRIWIAAPQHLGTHADNLSYVPIIQMDHESLQHVFYKLGEMKPDCSITISTPLGESIGPESGFVDSIAQHRHVHIWKRHSGDKFYAKPSPFDDLIEIQTDRYGPKLLLF
ncbi:uncharacterized protein JN550_010224 [Neoarthrinium moseri]|uniref:uncharacterized protein n=1 Tax=Neoarthrinium moseri TaxID=1658444 RepID=UPI001FDD7631|nr:uncharacterized protein JN550_010224 [Neoarthrinium moseri]KAI1862362.1 hypothetical protein JN550_010224 [Neoarthrinium moseri]